MIEVRGTRFIAIVSATALAMSTAQLANATTPAKTPHFDARSKIPDSINTGAVAFSHADTTQIHSVLSGSDDAQFEMWGDAINRLMKLSRLGDDHDGEGAKAPRPESVETALSFLRTLDFFSPDPRVGLDSDGNVAIEFHDGEEIGQIIFTPQRTVEAFHSRPGSESSGYDGPMDDEGFHNWFVETFGFQFFA